MLLGEIASHFVTRKERKEVLIERSGSMLLKADPPSSTPLARRDGTPGSTI